MKRGILSGYTGQQVSREDMELISGAENFAPNAGGGQRSMLVGSYVSKDQPSVIDEPSMKNEFYGAPPVVSVFGQDRLLFRTADAFCFYC